MIDVKRESVQDLAVQAWIDNNGVGTCEIHTGIGKTFVFFKCLQTLPKNTDVLFLAETTVRQQTVLDDAKFFKKLYKIDPLKNYNIKFSTYQMAYKFDIQYYFPNSKNVFICMDERLSM